MRQLLLIDDLREEEVFTPWDDLMRESQDAVYLLAEELDERGRLLNALVTMFCAKVRGDDEAEILRFLHSLGDSHVKLHHVRRMLIYLDLYQIDSDLWNLHDIEGLQYDRMIGDARLLAGYVCRWWTPAGWEFENPKVVHSQDTQRFQLLMHTIRGRFDLGPDPVPILKKWRELVHEPLEAAGESKTVLYYQQVFAVQFRWGLSYKEAKERLREIQSRGKK